MARTLSVARKRVVLMASCGAVAAGLSPMLERAVAGALHLPMAWIALPTVGLEAVWFAFLVTSLVRLKADEAREAENGSGEV